jgi:predicted component of type VI protein secretion system
MNAERRTGHIRSLFLTIEFPLGYTTIGSDPNCDVRLTGYHIEPLHACIIAGPSGVLLCDLSVSGISVNGSAIRGAGVLNNGDRLQIGGERFAFAMASAKNHSGRGDREGARSAPVGDSVRRRGPPRASSG